MLPLGSRSWRRRHLRSPGRRRSRRGRQHEGAVGQGRCGRERAHGAVVPGEFRCSGPERPGGPADRRMARRARGSESDFLATAAVFGGATWAGAGGETPRPGRRGGPWCDARCGRSGSAPAGARRPTVPHHRRWARANGRVASGARDGDVRWGDVRALDRLSSTSDGSVVVVASASAGWARPNGPTGCNRKSDV